MLSHWQPTAPRPAGRGQSRSPTRRCWHVMLPDGDGFSLLEELRRVGNGVPVLFPLRTGTEDGGPPAGWAWGRTTTSPSPSCLRSCCCAWRRCSAGCTALGRGRCCASGKRRCTGAPARRRPPAAGVRLPLTAKEYALLKKLAANRGNIVTIDALCQALWEGPMVGYENTLMVHIRRLREKLETDPSHPQYLLTVRGLGYRLAQEERP